MSWTVFAALMGGSFGAALVSLVQFLINRKDKKKADEKAEGCEEREAIKRIDEKVDALCRKMEEDRATNARIRILKFSDEVRHNVRHSKESFDQVNLDIDTYRRYCDDHPDYKNNRAVMAIANIERVYKDCLRKQDFLE